MISPAGFREFSVSFIKHKELQIGVGVAIGIEFLE